MKDTEILMGKYQAFKNMYKWKTWEEKKGAEKVFEGIMTKPNFSKFNLKYYFISWRNSMNNTWEPHLNSSWSSGWKTKLKTKS